jgi:hypothetical protein
VHNLYFLNAKNFRVSTFVVIVRVCSRISAFPEYTGALLAQCFRYIVRVPKTPMPLTRMGKWRHRKLVGRGVWLDDMNRKSLILSGSEPRSSCPITNHWTDWATPPNDFIIWNVCNVQVLWSESELPKTFQIIQGCPSEGSTQKLQVSGPLHKCDVCADEHRGQSGWYRMSRWDADQVGTESPPSWHLQAGIYCE